VRLFEVAEYPWAKLDQKTKVTHLLTNFVSGSADPKHAPTGSAIRMCRGGSHIGHALAWQIAHWRFAFELRRHFITPHGSSAAHFEHSAQR
jgi:hypothetical protein